MENDSCQTSLTSFNFDVPTTDKDNEGVLSKLLGKVKTAVAGQPVSYTQAHSLYSEQASASDVHSTSSTISVSSTRLNKPEPELWAPTTNNRFASNTNSSSSRSSLQRHIFVTSPTPPASSKDSVVVNFSSPGTTNYIKQDPVNNVCRLPQDDRSTTITFGDDYLGSPLSKSRSVDSDTQSIITTFSVSTSNSLGRILARLRGQKSDKEFWMPDEQCKECYKCRKPFTLLRRRHHCRTCGQIFCAKCASHAVPGKMYKQKGQVRQCNFCYSEDQQGETQAYISSALPRITETYTPVIPSQKPPVEAPQMQIPTNALKQTQSLYGNADATTVALEIPSRESPVDPKASLSPLITLSTPRQSFTETDTIGDGGLKRLLDAGTSLLKSRPRSNTSASAPLEGIVGSPMLQHLDRGGGTVMTESDLSACGMDNLSPHDQDCQGYDLWGRSAHFTPRLPLRAQSSGDMIVRVSGDSDDEAVDGRLRDKRTEELRGMLSHSPLRHHSMTHQRRNSRLRNIHINTTNLPKTDPHQTEVWSPNPFLLTDDTSSPKRTQIRHKRTSAPPNVELSYGALSHARNLLKQLMEETNLDDLSKKSKSVWEDTIMSLLLKVADNVRPDVRAGDDMDVRHYVKIKKIPGGMPSDSFYVKGVVCSKNVAHKRMVRPISHPRILILLFSLDYSRVEMENQLLSILPVITQEREHLSKLVGRIVALKPSLLLVKSTVSRIALEFLLEADIPVIHNVKHSVIEAVARCTQASVVPSVDKLQTGLSFGNCGSFEIRTMMHEWIPNRRKTYLIFDNCDPELGGTIVLRGATDRTLGVIKRLIDFMVFVINNLKLETSVLRDFFAKNKGVEQTVQLRPKSIKTVPATSTIGDEESPTQENKEEEEEHVESLDELLDVYRNTILSASPFVTFPPPYLLIRLKETEDRLSVAMSSRRQSNASPTRNPLERQATNEKPTEHANTVVNAELEHLVAKHNQLSRAWDAYIGENPDYISPFYHQNIVVLYSNVCTITTVPCQEPEIRIFEYYRYPSDVTLGMYLTDLFMDAKNPCASFMCDHPTSQHFRSYAHGEARINVMIEPFPCPLPGMSETLLMWSYCKLCERPTPVVPMSDNTWNYSFGKFLELFLYQTGVFCRADICPHDMARHHVRYFGSKDMAIQFQYNPIDLLEVTVPPMKLFMLSQVQIDLKEAELKTLRGKINKFYQSITERNKAFPFDLVDPRNLEACKTELQEMSHICVGEKKQVLQILQNVYATTEASDTLTMNWVRRILYQQISQWDLEYAELVRYYLQPERELRKITTGHLRKMFPADMSEAAITHMDDERTKRATEVTDLPLLGIGLEEEEECSSTGQGGRQSGRDPFDWDYRPSMLPSIAGSPSNIETNANCTLSGKSSKEKEPTSQLTNSRKSLLRPEIRRQLSMELMRELNSKFKKDNVLLDNKIPLFSGNYILSKRHVQSAAPFPPSRIPVPHLNAQRTASPLYEPYMPPHQRVKQTNKKPATKKPKRTSNTSIYKRPGFQENPSTVEQKSSAGVHYKPIPDFQAHKLPQMISVQPNDIRRAASPRDRNFRSRLPRKKTYIQVYTRANDLVKENMEDEFLVGDDPMDEDGGERREYDMFGNARMRDAPVDYFSPLAPYMSSVIDSPDGVLGHNTTPASETSSSTSNNTGNSVTEPAEDEFDRSDSVYSLPTAMDLLNPPSTGALTTSVSTSERLQEKKTEMSSGTSLTRNIENLEEYRHSPPEKNLFMKTITSFLTDGGVASLLPLEPPLQPTEHIFPDSFVVVREDEPSTIIAYTLSCDDYLTKMQEMNDGGGYDGSDSMPLVPLAAPTNYTLHDYPHDSGTTTSSNPSHIDIQETLLRESGTHMRYNFSDGTSKFFCKIFFSEQFDALRRNCGCDENYILSLASCLKWDSSGGKSGSAFLKTKDDRLLMKQMSRYELDAFLLFAPAYFQYMAEASFSELPTVLAKIFGFYSIGYKNSATGKSMRMDLLVMENLFYQRNVKKIFDLKGSMRNRHVQSTGKQDEVLLDENLVELIYQSPLFIRAYSKEILRSSLHNDTLFLSGRNVMDYSLLVGIDEERQELVVGIVDFIRTFTWDKKLESWVKESGFLGGGGKGPTIVSPKQYRIRFREAMERYFFMVPDLWALARQSRHPYSSLHHHSASSVDD
ncbi:hypothetical protein CLU79DRAFT_789750 [Phycomyces nitens]|nr:hypothetical protein CLU79DRAFT_789750 [Phycomyces nitens]